MKNKLKFLAAFTLLSIGFATAQVGIGTNTPDASAVLDVSSTNKGLLLPRLTTVERDAIATPATGLMIYNTTINMSQVNTGTPGTPVWTSAGGVQSFGQIRGTVTSVNVAGTYNVVDSDFLIITNNASPINIAFPALTNSAADIGRTVYVFNNNPSGGLMFTGVTAGNPTTNVQRGRIFVWSGSQWVNIGI